MHLMLTNQQYCSTEGVTASGTLIATITCVSAMLRESGIVF